MRVNKDGKFNKVTQFNKTNYLIYTEYALTKNSNTLDFNAVMGNDSLMIYHGRSFDSRPITNFRVPPNDRMKNASKILNFNIIQNNRVFDSNTFADNYSRTNCYVWANLLEQGEHY